MLVRHDHRGGSGCPDGTVWDGPLFTQLSINHYKLPSERAAILLIMHRSLALSPEITNIF